MRRTIGLLALAALLVAGLAPARAAHRDPTWTTGTQEVLAVPDEGYAEVAAVAMDAAGGIHALAGADPGKRLLLVERSPGSGWGPGVEIARDWTGSPVLALGVGDQFVGWTDRLSGVSYVRQRHGGGEWGTAQPLPAGHLVTSLTAVGDTLVVTALVKTGEVLGYPVHALEAVSRPIAGGAWSVPVRLSGADQVTSHDVMADAAGGATAVWACQSCTSIRSRTWTAAGWHPVTSVGPVHASTPLPRPTLAAEAGGGLSAFWQDYDGGVAPGIRMSSRTAPSEWSAPRLVAPGAAGEFRAASSRSGHQALAWSVAGGWIHVRTRAAGDGWTSTTALPGRSPVGLELLDDERVVLLSQSQSLAGTLGTVAGAWGEPMVLASAPLDAAVATDGAGSGVLMWREVAGGLPTRVLARGLDGAGPRIAVTAGPAVAGQPRLLSVEVQDVWSPVTSIAWDFGDGQTASGADVSQTWTSAGVFPVTVSATDAWGHTTTASTSVTVSAPPPVAPVPPAPPVPPGASTEPLRILAMSLRPRVVEIRSPKRARTRATLTIRLSHDARVRFTLTRRGAKKSWAWSRALQAGTSRMRLTARVKGRTLRPGTYRLVGRARNAAGMSAPRTVRLVVRR